VPRAPRKDGFHVIQQKLLRELTLPILCIQAEIFVGEAVQLINSGINQSKQKFIL
jgi:hypothetical protein